MLQSSYMYASFASIILLEVLLLNIHSDSFPTHNISTVMVYNHFYAEVPWDIKTISRDLQGLKCWEMLVYNVIKEFLKLWYYRKIVRFWFLYMKAKADLT